MMIFENDEIIVKETNRQYDFIATIENKTNSPVLIVFKNEDIPSIIVSDWIGILADEEGYETLNALRAGTFVVQESCD